MKYLMVGFIFLNLLFSYGCYALCLPNLWYGLIPGIDVGAFGGINGGYDLRCRHVKTIRGYYAGLKIDKSLFCYLRLEEELAWQWNEVNSIKNATVQFDHMRGDINIWSLMTNGIFDIPFNCRLPARPYVGGGVGYAYTSGNWVGSVSQNPTINTANNAQANNAVNPQTNLANETVCFTRRHIKSNIHKGGFAWQIIAGLNFPICCFKIGLEYRYFKSQRDISNHKFGLALVKLF